MCLGRTEAARTDFKPWGTLEGWTEGDFGFLLYEYLFGWNLMLVNTVDFYNPKKKQNKIPS